MNWKILIAVLGLLFLSGCSGFYIDDGVLRNESGTSIITEYNDVPVANHEQTALFEGRAFIFSSHFTTNVGVPVYFVGCVQDTVVHFENFDLELEGTPFDVHFYEAPVLNTNGTPVSAFNLDRNSANNHTMNLYANPSVNTTGTQLFHATTYGKSNLAGSTVIPNELIMRTNTCYLFEILNNNGATAEVTANFIWHEAE